MIASTGLTSSAGIQAIKPTESLGELNPGHLYNVKGRQLIFTGKDIGTNTTYKFIDIQMPQSIDRQSLLNANISDFRDAIINPKECAKTLLTSPLFGYNEEILLVNVQSGEYYTIGDDGTPINSKEKDQSKAPPGPYYWRKIELRDKSFFTSPTSASNIQAGAYKSGNVKGLYDYYMKQVIRI
jgi:hypothetical protein